MEMLNLSLPANNRFATDYLAQTPDVMQFFHYNYQNDNDYIERVKELQHRSFKRKELAEHIRRYMARFPSSTQVEQSFKKLQSPDSVVVIGGQQAGILTGPLYTLYKVISIIAFARKKEKDLGIPVVPVFWIAGEDHDYMEVNHFYAEVNDKIKKFTFPQVVTDKKMVSDIMIERSQCIKWVENVFETFGETEYTKDLLKFVRHAIEQSETMVDFFSFIIMEWFKEFGLLIIDSGDKQLRLLEKEFFERQIKGSRAITDCILKQQHELKLAGFYRTLEIKDNAANLFYYDEASKCRILLEYDAEKNLFVGKNGIYFSFEQLLNFAKEEPQRFSNNVATRPLTQEWLFPTLAFVAGPGEIAYWSELKKVFEHFALKVPPIIPRLNITLLERSIETDLAELGFDLTEVMKNGIGDFKKDFLNSVMDPELAKLFDELKKKVDSQYQKIIRKTEEIDRSLLPLVKKNESLVFKQIHFIEDKIRQSIEKRHEVILRKMDRVENALKPNGLPQERIMNPFYYVNKYGLDFVQELTKMDFRFDGLHKVIKI
jgi:bacillithiol biosynthesis cysteine-adding enzyme BshC